MNILIVSDSHGREDNLIKAINLEKPIDMLIHLGDSNGNIEYIKSLVDCPVHIVCGNNDFFCDVESDIIIDISKFRVLLTHGHRYGVSYDLERVKNIGRQYGVDIIMYGHTHIPHIDISGDIWAINPGSISLPRQSDDKPTYIIMEIDNLGKANFTLKQASKF